MARGRGFKWAGSELPKNVITNTLWECEKGDMWEATYNNVQQGSGCPYCSGLVKKTEQDYYELTKGFGFKWVGEVLPKNTMTKTWWQCEKGDRWESCYDTIRQGNGCPICNVKIE